MNGAIMTAIIVFLAFFLMSLATFFGSFMLNNRDPQRSSAEDDEQEQYLKQYMEKKRAKMK